MKCVLFFILGLFISNSALAKLPKSSWEVKQGRLTYHVHYVLKSVEGISEAVKGKGNCSSGRCQFLVAVPVKTFNSGDGNRDNHMLEVTKAALNPMVAVKVEFPENAAPGEVDAKIEVNFAGKTHKYEHVKIVTKIDEGKAVTTGQVPLILSHFDVERPALLGVKIDDSTPVDFAITWN